MALFLSTYTNRLDKKGRISVPAPFRAQLQGEVFHGAILFPSGTHQALEGFAYSKMEDLNTRLETLDILSNTHDDLAASVFGGARPLPLDGEGRIILPQDLIEFAALEDEALFVGLGSKFQIWHPDRFKVYQKEALKNIADRPVKIPDSPKGQKDSSS